MKNSLGAFALTAAMATAACEDTFLLGANDAPAEGTAGAAGTANEKGGEAGSAGEAGAAGAQCEALSTELNAKLDSIMDQIETVKSFGHKENNGNANAVTFEAQLPNGTTQVATCKTTTDNDGNTDGKECTFTPKSGEPSVYTQIKQRIYPEKTELFLDDKNGKDSSQSGMGITTNEATCYEFTNTSTGSKLVSQESANVCEPTDCTSLQKLVISRMDAFLKQ